MTGSELAAKLRHIAPRHVEGQARNFAFRMEGLCLQELNELINQAADFIEQTITPPEGDTVSGEVVERIEDMASYLESDRDDAAWPAQLDKPGSATRLATARDLRAAVAAIQSRVSPQEGREQAIDRMVEAWSDADAHLSIRGTCAALFDAAQASPQEGL